MPDQLFDTLTDDLAVRPLPAAEVRRRGDRRRRRQRAAAGIAGLAAVAAVIVGVGVAVDGRGADRMVPAAPTPTPSVALTTVPADFLLTRGMPSDPAPTQSLMTDTRRVGGDAPQQLDFCDVPFWLASDAAQTLLAHWTDGAEAYEYRTLSTYPSTADAATAFDRILTVRGGCLTREISPIVVPIADPGTIGPGTIGPDGVIAWVAPDGHPWPTAGGAGIAYVAARVGNALLIDRANLMSATDPAVRQQTVDNLLHRLAPVLASMCVFSTEPCGHASTTTSPTSTGTVPAVLGPVGYDRLTVGMTYAEAMATGEIAELPTRTNGVRIELGDHPDAALCMSQKGGLMAIFLGAGMHTPEGIGLGSPVADLVAAYPDLKPMSDGPVGGPGVFRAAATGKLWYEIDVNQKRQVSAVILRQDHQTCFE